VSPDATGAAPDPNSPLDAALTEAAADLIDELEEEVSRAGHDWDRLAELSARLVVAQRILGLHKTVQQLEGLLPICSYCKRIRAGTEAWSSLETYIEQRSAAEFSHGICPDCYAKHIEPKVR